MSMSHGGGETQLTDQPLAAEIELLGEVITVVATHSGPLSPDEVDDVLGVGEPEPPDPEIEEPELEDPPVPEPEPPDAEPLEASD
jgi:hypothetical protein